MDSPDPSGHFPLLFLGARRNWALDGGGCFLLRGTIETSDGSSRTMVGVGARLPGAMEFERVPSCFSRKQRCSILILVIVPVIVPAIGPWTVNALILIPLSTFSRLVNPEKRVSPVLRLAPSLETASSDDGFVPDAMQEGMQAGCVIFCHASGGKFTGYEDANPSSAPNDPGVDRRTAE